MLYTVAGVSTPDTQLLHNWNVQGKNLTKKTSYFILFYFIFDFFYFLKDPNAISLKKIQNKLFYLLKERVGIGFGKGKADNTINYVF